MDLLELMVMYLVNNMSIFLLMSLELKLVSVMESMLGFLDVSCMMMGCSQRLVTTLAKKFVLVYMTTIMSQKQLFME